MLKNVAVQAVNDSAPAKLQIAKKKSWKEVRSCLRVIRVTLSRVSVAGAVAANVVDSPLLPVSAAVSIRND